MRYRIISAFAALALMLAVPYAAHSQPSATKKATSASTSEPNVYVREILGLDGWLKIDSFEYAGKGKWDDCDNCASALKLSATKDGVVYHGPAAEGMPGATYKLTLKHGQTLRKGSYHYRTVKGDRLVKVNNHWNGMTSLLERRGNTYLSHVFFAYYDNAVAKAEKGLHDPTAP
jgi:hypothetical protein